MTKTINIEAKPFLKWAGGKGQLIPQLQRLIPQEFSSTGRIKKYIEPFLGGGAFFFWLCNEFEIDEAILVERNLEVAATYKIVRDNVKHLIKELKDLELQYVSANEEGREELYYLSRKGFNVIRKQKKSAVSLVHQSALLIFLNKTCFNGLYRVNSKGEFNVPFGRYKNPRICNEGNLIASSESLKRANILAGDFSQCLQGAEQGAFVYFDPPYRPISTTSSFTSYSKDVFDDDEQRRLRDVYEELDKLGAFVLLSNSDPKNLDSEDSFFDDLYKGYRIERVKANRIINCCAEKRGEINEILVTNYSL